MLRLIDIATNTDFELDRDIKIPFLFFNPYFEDQGSLTYSATMSAKSDINRRLTNYQNIVGKNTNSDNFIPVILELTGQRKRCTMQILKADDINIKFNLLFDESNIIVKYGEENIKNFEYDGEQTIISDGTSAIGLADWTNADYEKIYPEVKAAFPLIYNPNFLDGTAGESDYKNFVKAQNLPNNLIADDIAPGEKENVITPMPFLAYVLNKLMEEIGYNVDYNHFEIEELINLIFLNVTDCSDFYYTYTAPDYILGPANKKNYYIKNHLPSITIKALLKQLKNKFNIHLFTNEQNQTVSFHSLNESLKKPVSIDLSKYHPALSLEKIVNYTSYAFIDSGNHTTAYDEKGVDVREIYDRLIYPPITNQSQLPDGQSKIGDVKQLTFLPFSKSIQYWEFQQIDDGGGPYVAYNPLGFNDFGNFYSSFPETTNELKFESSVTTSPESTQSIPIAGATNKSINTVNFPLTGSSLAFANEDADAGLNLAFYNKKNAPTGVVDYPAAGTVNRLSTNEVSLAYNEIYGLIKQHWERTVEMFMNKGRVFKGKLQLPVSMLLNFDFTQKYKIHSGTFMVKNIKGNFTMKGIEYTSSEIKEV